jgi:hypothetical protein
VFETILITFAVARIKGYRILPFFKSWTVYPVLVLEFIYLIFQIQIFIGNYSVIQYAPILKRVYLFCFIVPIIVYKEYKEGLIGSIFVFVGTFLNQFVIRQNGGKMPVFPNFSYITGYVNPRAFGRIDGIHILGDETTRFWFLSDIIDIGYSVLSIGDILIRIFVFVVVLRTIQIMGNREDAIQNRNHS